MDQATCAVYRLLLWQKHDSVRAGSDLCAAGGCFTFWEYLLYAVLHIKRLISGVSFGVRPTI